MTHTFPSHTREQLEAKVDEMTAAMDRLSSERTQATAELARHIHCLREAAPDLLKALEKLAKAIAEESTPGTSICPDCTHPVCIAWGEAFAAIKKARGEP